MDLVSWKAHIACFQSALLQFCALILNNKNQWIIVIVQETSILWLHWHLCWGIDHFRVTLCLCFKLNPREKYFKWKWVWFPWKRTCREHIFIWMVLHEASFRLRGKRQLGNLTPWNSPQAHLLLTYSIIRFYSVVKNFLY